MIKNVLSVEEWLVGLACKRNEILWSSAPMTRLMVEMYITKLGVQSEGHEKWRMRARTRNPQEKLKKNIN
jgi:hypothetical protein